MVVAKIEEIDSRDRIRIVRLSCNHIIALAAEKHFWLLKQVACDKKDLSL